MKKISIFLTAAIAMFSVNYASAQNPKHSSEEEFKIGIAGYTLYAFGTDGALEVLQKLGVKYFSVKDRQLPLNSTTEEMEAFKAKCAAHGVTGYTLGPIYMKSREEVDVTFAYAQRYGAKMFIGVPDYELLPYVIEKVKETGIKVAIHTHGPDGAAFPDIRTVVELVKDPSLGVGCCMDLGHTFRSGYDVANDIKKYGKWIYDIHIKDETAPTKEGRCIEMGCGQMNFKAIFKALRQIKYQGVISLEHEKELDAPLTGMAQSVGYLRGIIDGTSK
ncbi:MAG: sugar phosphate isomerase/epimerase [Alistipes sp.]|nr:sugar phosphate isomerase/epimerase [Candidatus Minthomonas equi]